MRNKRRAGNNNSRRAGVRLGAKISTFVYVRAAMGAGTLLVLFFLLFARLVPEKISLEPGVVADRTIIAPRSVDYADTQTTEERQQLARDTVPDRYTAVPEAGTLVAQTIDDIFAAVTQAREEAAVPI